VGGVTYPVGETYAQVQRFVHAMMTAAMRADPAALDAGAAVLDIDPYSREFVRQARRLVLAGGTAITAVLAAHRPGNDPYDQEICRACGTRHCRTLRHLAEAFAAYAIRPVAADRAEAWRRADIGFGAGAGALIIEESEECFIARPSSPAPGGERYLLVVDRRTGALTRWPDLPSEQLIDHYRSYLRGEL
jgi:hypothetical protein